MRKVLTATTAAWAALGMVVLMATLAPSGMGWPGTDSNQWERVAYAAPVQINAIQNLVDNTGTACDPTGHCARIHVVVQRQDGVQGRAFASITCYDSVRSSFACAGLTGFAQLNCNLPDGTDCTQFGGQASCGRLVGPNNPGPATCPTVLSTTSPWFRAPSGVHPIANARGAFSIVTGAAGGGTIGLDVSTGITGI